MECQYGKVAPTTSEVLNPGSDKYFVPGSGIVYDYVQMRRQMGGRMEKKSVMKKDYKKDLNVTNFVRQVNEGEKNTYFYKLRRVLPGLHDTRAGQPVGKILPGRSFQSVVGAAKMPVNGNYLRRVGRGTSENNDLFRRPYEPTSTAGMGEFQKSYAAPEMAYPMQGVEEQPDMMSIVESFNRTPYRPQQPAIPSVVDIKSDTTPSEGPSDVSMGSGTVTKPSSGLSSLASDFGKIIFGEPVSRPDRGLGAEDISMAPSTTTAIPEDVSMAPSSTGGKPKSMYEYDESIGPGDSVSQIQVPMIGEAPRINPTYTRSIASASQSQIGDSRASMSRTMMPQQTRSVVSNPQGPAVARKSRSLAVPTSRRTKQRKKKTPYDREMKKKKKGSTRKKGKSRETVSQIMEEIE